MHFKPSDAAQHTGLATTPARQAFWSTAANRIWSVTGDEAGAARIANNALHQLLIEQSNRRLARTSSYAPRLF